MTTNAFEYIHVAGIDIVSLCFSSLSLRPPPRLPIAKALQLPVAIAETESVPYGLRSARRPEARNALFLPYKLSKDFKDYLFYYNFL